jgi:glycosyltransferase involved in cell wall biosynthesis
MSDSRVSVAYVAHTLNPGGTERLVADMARAFAREFDIRIVCLDEPGTWAEDLRSEGIPVHCVWRQPGFDPAVPLRLAGLFRRWGTRLVHAHQCTPWFYAALSRLRYSAPRLLFEEHGRFYPESDHLLRRVVNRHLISRLTHEFVAVSADVRRRLARYEGVPGHRINVVYNGTADAPRLDASERARLRRDLGLESSDIVVGLIGRLDPIKNPVLLLRSVAELTKSGVPVRLLIAGDGPLRSDIERAVVDLRLGDAVQMLGFRNDTRRLMQILDVYALPSFSEGTSMALLEAMSAGVPAVATAVGGTPEILEYGVTGWLVPSDDLAALTDAIREAAIRPDIRAGRAAAARKRYEGKYTAKHMLDRYRDIYARLLGVPLPPAVSAV